MFGRIHVLDAGYQYVGTMSWQRASWLAYTGVAEVLISSDIRLRHDFNLPSLIRVMKSVRKLFKNGVAWNRDNMFVRDLNTCVYCGETFHVKRLTIDHVMPKSKGGRLNWKNAVTACKPCNNRKDNCTPSEAGMHFHDSTFRPHQPTVMEYFLNLLKLEGLDGAFAKLGIY